MLILTSVEKKKTSSSQPLSIPTKYSVGTFACKLQFAVNTNFSFHGLLGSAHCEPNFREGSHVF